MSAKITEDYLRQFSGSDQYYRHWTRAFYYTDGCHYLAENGAGWLIDAIASHQTNPKLKKGMLRDFQLWELKVNLSDKTAVLTCKADSDIPPAITQKLEFTDFPLEDIAFCVNRGSIDGQTETLICMLRSEY